MKVNIESIPPEGCHLTLGPTEGWFVQILSSIFGNKFSDPSGKVTLNRLEDLVTFFAQVNVVVSYECDRGLNSFHKPYHFEFKMNLLPQIDDDIDFASYQDHCINLDHLIHESLILELPISILCNPECKGLCMQCGHDLNLSPCPLHPA